MAAISLSSLVHSNGNFRGTSSLETPSTGPRRSRSSPQQSPRQSPRRVPYHTPLPTSTNYPTSAYHRPVSPIPRPLSPCPRPVSPCGRMNSNKSSSRGPSPTNSGSVFAFDSSSGHSSETGNAHLALDDSGLTSLGFQPESPRQTLEPVDVPSGNVERSDDGAHGQSKNLQCGVCLKNYQDARLLPCFHSFCASCLESSCLQKGCKNKPDSVYCPICTESTELTSRGVQGLPKNMYVEHLVDLQGTLFKTKTNCDLCVGSEVASSHCKNCNCNLCEFCTQAHQKQRKTSYHSLVSIGDDTDSSSSGIRLVGSGGSGSGYPSRKASTSSKTVLYCKEHRKEVTESYCEDCEILVCGKCVEERHAQHRLSSLQEVNEQYSELLHGLLLRANPLADSIEEATQNIGFVSNSIQERTLAISEEIIEFVTFQMKALQEHKRLLLLQLDAVKNQKVSTLEAQLKELKLALQELTTNSDQAQKALEQGIPSEAFGADNTATRLEELIVGKYELSPSEDDYIQFHRHLQTQESNGLPMFGVLDSKGPSAAQTIAEGEGLYEAREGKSTKFKVVVCDRYKQQREVGGDRVEASMINKKGDIVYLFVNDREDGVYDISYNPNTSGEHQLSVLVDEKHIRGSPFAVRVHPRRGKHNGIFHCCTFCSSGGKKHIRCGCGSVMPGGYSGCGHGHPGHPGCRHWSCCGNVKDNSECL